MRVEVDVALLRHEAGRVEDAAGEVVLVRDGTAHGTNAYGSSLLAAAVARFVGEVDGKVNASHAKTSCLHTGLTTTARQFERTEDGALSALEKIKTTTEHTGLPMSRLFAKRAGVR
jgi:hypothetical protein